MPADGIARGAEKRSMVLMLDSTLRRRLEAAALLLVDT